MICEYQGSLNVDVTQLPIIGAKNVIKIIDISYGMENGLHAAIEQSSETLSNVKLMHEKKVIQKYFEEIAQNTGKYSFMIKDTITALEMSAIDTIIVWEDLNINRITLYNSKSEGNIVLYLTEEQEKNDKYFFDTETGVKLEMKEKVNFLEWIAENYKSFGANLELVTDRSQEGSQFCKGFGGVGSLLRWKVDFDDMNYDDLDNYEYNSSDDDFI